MSLSETETSGVQPRTDYAKSGDIHVAYQLLGGGPVNLVFVPGFVSHVEHFWEDPSLARFLRPISVPTLVLHRRGELVVPVEEGRFIAEQNGAFQVPPQ